MYRIYTEDKNVSEVTAIVSKYFSGFTIFNGIGHWKSVLESSLVIEIVNTEKENNVTRQLVLRMATEIREFNKQESVLVVYVEAESILI